jgi:hypothetical protein
MQDIDELADVASDSDFVVGEQYVFQTATLWLFAGECKEVTKTHVVFERASWIQEMGRLGEFFRVAGTKPQFSEFMGEDTTVRVARSMIVWDVLVSEIPTDTVPAAR